MESINEDQLKNSPTLPQEIPNADVSQAGDINNPQVNMANTSDIYLEESGGNRSDAEKVQQKHVTTLVRSSKRCEEINFPSQSPVEPASDFSVNDSHNLKEGEICKEEIKQTEDTGAISSHSNSDVIECTMRDSDGREQYLVEDVFKSQQMSNSDEQIGIDKSQLILMEERILEEENEKVTNASNPLEEEQLDEAVGMEIGSASVVSDNLTDSDVHDIAKKGSIGLSMLAQYGSDSEFENGKSDSESEDDKSTTDSVVEIPIVNNTDYRNQTIQIDSESDSESDIECLEDIRKIIENRISASNDDCNEEEGDEEDEECGDGTKKKGKPRPPRVKGELLLDDLPPIKDLHITVPEGECVELGKIHSIVDQLVLVSALPNALLLNLDTVLFLEKGQRVLGEVFDVLGQVAEPLYCVRFNSHEQVMEKNIKVGDAVYAAPKTEYTQFIILSSLMKMRGSDASWEHDVEPPPRYIDYSDDEEERLARSRLRNKDKTTENDGPDDHNEEECAEKNEEQVKAHSKKKRRRQNEQNHSFGFQGNRGSRHINAHPRHMGSRPAMFPSSWHSNYYPQAFGYYPPPNYRYGPQMASPMAQGGYPLAAPNMYETHPRQHMHLQQPSTSSSTSSAHSVPNPFNTRSQPL
uniref:H/ACA ribonucleoprotein complex non-core subunit NAF1 n=1 Tax=Glossina pallidipes TaxID=7398 RepID=A0A1A9ZEW0_GLOPL